MAEYDTGGNPPATDTMAVFPIMALPREVLRMIFEIFCNHCYQKGPRHPEWAPGRRWKDPAPSRRALAALCCTSHGLRTLALPILYHDAGQFFNLNTLIQRLGSQPDLADCVRTLEFPMDILTDPKLTLRRHKNIARKVFLDTKGVLNLKNKYRVKNKQPPAKGWKCDYPSAITTELLLALSPNVDTVKISYCCSFDVRSDPNPTLLYLQHRFRQLGDAPGLPNLRNLNLRMLKDYRSGGFFGFASDGVSVLLGAAPRLENLVLLGCSRFGAYPEKEDFKIADIQAGLRNLKALEFPVSNIESDEDGDECQMLREICTLASRLETFRFIHSDAFINKNSEHHISSAEILSALEPRHQTLKHLELDLNHAPYLDERRSPAMRQIRGPELAKFVKLRTLGLGERSFCRHSLPKDEVGPELDSESHTCLTALLPPTVDTLAITIVENWASWNDILHLGKCVVEGEFPNLKRVEVLARRTARHPTRPEMRLQYEKVQDHLPVLRAAFRGSGIELHFESLGRLSGIDWSEWYSYSAVCG